MKHLIDWSNWDSNTVQSLLTSALDIKANPEKYKNTLKGKSLAMLFEKTSTRTRISFEVAMNQMGGSAIFIDPQHSQIKKTKLSYEIKIISKYCDFIMARLKKNEDFVIVSQSSDVPTINGCCNKYHPCQTLADLITIYEHNKNFTEVNLVYVGIYNNVANSLVSIANHFKLKLTLVCPIVLPNIVDNTEKDKALNNGLLNITNRLKDALKDADFVYTDTWLDMEFFNNPDSADLWEERQKKMLPFQVKESILNARCKVMHDMPIHVGCEIEEVLVESSRSIIYQQGENRLYAQKAILNYFSN